MLGSAKANARPTVVIFHNDEKILKKTMKVILRSKVLNSKGFELKGSPNCDVKLLTTDSTSRLKHHLDELGQGLPISLCGAEIEVKDQVRSATLGGILILDGTYYGVTVAHAFTESPQTLQEKPRTDVMLYDSDWAELSSGDESISQGSSTDYRPLTSLVANAPEKTNCPSMACAIRINRPLLRHEMGDYPVAVISSQNPLCNADSDDYDDVDWALIEISNPVYHGMNGVASDEGKQNWLAFSSFRNHPPRGSILAVTRKGTVRGLGTGSTSSIKLLGSSRNRDVWSIQTERELELGDSGAWVADAATGDIYGVLVAGSALVQEGYVIPARDVIDDIRKSTKAHELRLPTMSDVLSLASRYGNVDLVKSLIAGGVVINERRGITESSTALLEAAQHEQLEVMKLLLSLGAKFDKQGGQTYGRIAVLAAQRSEHTLLVKDLLSAGAQPWSSLSVPRKISTVEGQDHTHYSSAASRKVKGINASRLTAGALERVQKSTTTQLDEWLKHPEPHEQLGTIGKTERSIMK